MEKISLMLWELIVRCYQEEKVSMLAFPQKFSCSKKKIFLYKAINLYNKTRRFETPARKSRVRNPILAEDKIICKANNRNRLLFSREIKAEIGQNITSEIVTRTIKRCLQESWTSRMHVA